MREQIIRITPTTAITNFGTKLKLEVKKDGFVQQINAGKFNSKTFFIETEELKNLFQKKVIISKISNFDFTKLDLQYLIKILEIIKT
ncbi:MAG: hypothetical protein WCJ58_00855 [bacterium]